MPHAAGLEQELLCVVWFSVSVFGHGCMERKFTLPANLSLCFGNPLDWEQKSGAGPVSTSATRALCAWAWRTQVLRESETVSEIQRSAGYTRALGVCCCGCWLSCGEEGSMFFLFRIAYQAVGEEEITLEEGEEPWLLRRWFKLADTFLCNF